jgi:carboxypeptidase Q
MAAAVSIQRGSADMSFRPAGYRVLQAVLLFGFMVQVGGPDAVGALAGEPIDYQANARIRAEGRDRSQIMRTLHFLTDVYGPRLTGSPNHEAAAQWAAKQMTEWGLENAHLEPWDFGRPGWQNERFTGFILSPVKDSLVGEVLAWTPGTNGTATAQAAQIVPPRCVPSLGARPGEPQRCPDEAELNTYLETVRSRVRGRIVLVGAHTTVGVTFSPAPLRRDDEQVRAQYDPSNPGAGAGPSRAADEPQPGRLTNNAINEKIDQFLLANGALLRLNDAGRDHGQIRAFQNRTYDPSKAPPTVVLRNEDYGRISRILEDGTPVELEFTIVNRSYPEGRTSYNVIAEIPGTDKKNEIVMLGGHLDSWHAATGATDNAIGCAVMMEAARILNAAGLKPRRTIRVALWSGEEQGLLGSKAYVRRHFGSFEEPAPAFEAFNGYFNVDSGTGRIRGATVFGPAAAATVVREALAAFEDFGVVGAVATRSRRAGGTDSTSFNEAGLPGIGFGQDPIQYNSYTWHTNLDTYERIVEADVKKSAIAIAGAVYHLATREERLPRFTKEEMPQPSPRTQRTQ